MNELSAESICERVRDLLLATPGCRLGLVYGSTVNGTLRADSDVDVAVLYDESLDAARKMELMARLHGAVRRPVDLVDLTALHGFLLGQILRHGRLVVDNDQQAWAMLVRRHVYDGTDWLPKVRAILHERQERFLHG